MGIRFESRKGPGNRLNPKVAIFEWEKRRGIGGLLPINPSLDGNGHTKLAVGTVPEPSFFFSIPGLKTPRGGMP